MGSGQVVAELVQVREEQARLLASNLLPRDVLPTGAPLHLPTGDLSDWKLGLSGRLVGLPAAGRTTSAR